VTPKEATRVCAIYVRVSSVRGRKGDSFHSPKLQKKMTRAAIKFRGWTEHDEVFKDLDVSGTSMDREQFNRALAWVNEDPRHRAIGVYDLDRWGRVTGDMLTALDDLYKVGGEMVIAGKLGLDYGTDEGKDQAGTDAVEAGRYSRRIGRNWRRAQAARLDKGKHMGGPPRFGYRKVKGKSVLRVDPVNGPILAEMYRSYIAGKGAQSICRDLNARGVKTQARGSIPGGEWSVQSLLRTLDSGFGAGLIRRAKGSDIRHPITDKMIGQRSENEYLKGKHEPVITTDEWTLYRAKREGKRVLAPKHRVAHSWLAGIARCGLCGERLTVTTHDPDKASVSQALCSKYKAKRACSGVWVSRPYLESVVGLWLGGRVDQLASEAAGRRPSQEKRLADAEKLVKRTAAAVEALVDQQAEFAVESVRLNPKVLARAAAKMEAELAKAEAAHEAATVAHAEVAADVDGDVFEQLQKAFGGDIATDVPVESIEASEWNALVARVIDRVTVTKDDIVITSKAFGKRAASTSTYVRTTTPRVRSDIARAADGKFVSRTATEPASRSVS
jgi:site-specific DNA recombinase